MTNCHGFPHPTPSGKAFLGGSGWILAYKAYIHYGPWLLCSDEPLKASKSPKTGLKMANFHGFEPRNLLVGFFGWIWVDPCL